MNRKGDLFMLGLNLLFLVALILLFWKISIEFEPQNPNEGIGTRQIALLNTYGTAEEILLKIDLAARDAALEAQGVLLERGGIDPYTNPCKTYASYQRWSSPDGKECMPSAQLIRNAFVAEFDARLPQFVQLNRFINIPYTYALSVSGSSLVLNAVANKRIELPILAVKDESQRTAENVLDNANVLSQQISEKDTDLVTQSLPSPSTQPREGAITHVLLIPAGTPVSAAIETYTKSTQSIHYLIDARGTITQMVRESRVALACTDACAQLLPTSITIGLETDALETIGEGTPQYVTLIALLADRMKDRGLDASALTVEADEAKQWLGGVGTAAQASLGQQTVEDQEETPEQEVAATPEYEIQWPADSLVVTSCWGARPGVGDGFHDGIDVRGIGTPVYAFTGGEVMSIVGDCREGASCRSSYGNNIILKHSDNLYSRYSHMQQVVNLKQGDTVRRGAQIGTIGNTGASKGAHLDFKVYTSADLSSDKGINPLCLFPDELLRTLTFTGSYCKYGTPLTHQDAVLLQECAGQQPLAGGTAQGVCTFGDAPLAASGDTQVTATEKRLREQELMDDVESAAQEFGVEKEIIIALIATESGGVPDYVNSVGAVGIGQIRPDAATDLKRIGVFPREANAGCTCKDRCRASTVPACTGDVRLDPALAIRGVAAYFKLQKTYLEEKGHTGLTDMTRMMIGSYNQGAGAISSAINKAKARGIADPRWEDIARDVREEGRNYVPRVTQYYTSYGKSLGTAFSDQLCTDGSVPVTAKELGRYWFAPSFTTQVPDALTQLDQVSAFAKETYQRCDGSDPKRTSECLTDQKDKWKDRLTFVDCASVDADPVARDFEQFMSDCKANKQDACTCAWTPSAEKFQVRLYGETPHVFVDDVTVSPAPPGVPIVQFQKNPENERQNVTLSLERDGTTQEMVLWQLDDPGDEGDLESFTKDPQRIAVESFRLLKDKDTLVWSATVDEDIPACGAYKTEHHVCVKLQTPTYLASRKEVIHPIARFSLFLNDKVPPTPPSVIAIKTLTHVSATLDASEDEDVSYYHVWCNAAGVTPSEKDQNFRKVLKNDVGEELSFSLDECIPGGVAVAGNDGDLDYFVSVIAYDTSGLASVPKFEKAIEADAIPII